jgi:hypothetical protein
MQKIMKLIIFICVFLALITLSEGKLRFRMRLGLAGDKSPRKNAGSTSRYDDSQRYSDDAGIDDDDSDMFSPTTYSQMCSKGSCSDLCDGKSSKANKSNSARYYMWTTSDLKAKTVFKIGFTTQDPTTRMNAYSKKHLGSSASPVMVAYTDKKKSCECQMDCYFKLLLGKIGSQYHIGKATEFFQLSIDPDDAWKAINSMI